jgi:hypothetical protein
LSRAELSKCFVLTIFCCCAQAKQSLYRMGFQFFFFQLLLLLLILQHCSSSIVSESEIIALYDLWSETQGSLWHWRENGVLLIGQPWNFSTPLNASQPCLQGADRWQGVNCSNTDDSITGLFLPSFGMNGTISTSFCDLFALQLVTFASNMLHGELPSCISRLTALSVLDLKRNELTGPIPESVWDMTQLRILVLLNNRLTGTLSPAVGKLTHVWMLDLASNLLSGPLPTELGMLQSLEYLPIGACMSDVVW